MRLRTAACAGVAALLFASAAGARKIPVRVYARNDRDAYVLSTHRTMTSMNISTDMLGDLDEAYGSDFLWLRRHGKTYVIRDRSILEQAAAMFAPLRALDPEHESISRRERQVDRKEEALDREKDRISDTPRRDRTDEDEDRLQELDEQFAAVREEARDIEDRERELDRRSDAMERDIESKLWVMIDGWIADGKAAPARPDVAE